MCVCVCVCVSRNMCICINLSNYICHTLWIINHLKMEAVTFVNKEYMIN